MLVLLLVALCFILRGDLFYVLPCIDNLLCFSVLLELRLPRLGKRELILVLFVRLIGLCLFGFLFHLGLGRVGVCECDTPWTFLLPFSLQCMSRKRIIIAVLFVRLFGLCLFGCVGFLFFLGSGKGCVLAAALPGFFSYLFFSYLFCNSGVIILFRLMHCKEKGKRKVQGVSFSQTAALPRPKWKRKPNKHKPIKRTKSTKISSLFPKRGNRNSKRTEKHNKLSIQGKT